MDFINWISKPVPEEELKIWFSVNNIVYERSELYKDFCVALMTLINDTYFGDKDGKFETEVEMSDEDNMKHFDWCWNKTIENFKEEGIDFSGNNNLYEYFLNFMLETFYLSKKKSDKLHFNLLKLWSYLFGYTIPKSRSDVDSFIEVYKLFDKSLKKPEKTMV